MINTINQSSRNSAELIPLNLKKGDMSDLKLKQLQYESNTWKRLLGFIMEENMHLKNRIAELLKDRFDSNLLEEVEDFQSRFVKEDELISLLRNDVAKVDRLLVREIFEDGKIIHKVNTDLKKMRNDITMAEKEFCRLKSEFNNYLSENILPCD
jgi:tRNA A37 N6-isopentenylltransferase MiaA